MRNALFGLALVAAVAVGFAGCSGDQTPEDKIASISKSIRIGTASATAVGLVAIPDEAEADKIAAEAIKTLEENVLPILEGDEQGLLEGLARLRDLSVFDNNPELHKFKMILETALPLLEANLPDDLVDQGLEKVPADVKAYMTAFFRGVYEGAKAYAGDGDGLQGGGKFHKLRENLAE